MSTFQTFAKELAAKMKVECAESNPYIQALAAHREAYSQSIIDLRTEVVDSLEVRLATQRNDALATLRMKVQQKSEPQDEGSGYSGVTATLDSVIGGFSGAASSSSTAARGASGRAASAAAAADAGSGDNGPGDLGKQFLAVWPPVCLRDSRSTRTALGVVFTPGREREDDPLYLRSVRCEAGRDGVASSVTAAAVRTAGECEDDCRPSQPEDLRSGTSTTARSVASGSEDTGACVPKVFPGDAIGDGRSARDDPGGEPFGSGKEPGHLGSASSRGTGSWFGDYVWDRIFNANQAPWW